MIKNSVFIELGGNLGDRLNLINQAKKMLQILGCNIIQQSSIYETPPWGFEADQSFYNQIVKIETKLNPIELIGELQEIEKKLGRIRGSEKYESRTMDLDILFFNDEIINTNQIIIPHPRLHLRNFVLFPLNEMATDFIHPTLLKNIGELLSTCTDNSKCTKIAEITP